MSSIKKELSKQEKYIPSPKEPKESRLTGILIKNGSCVVDHEKFLASRFDLVIRWYFLEKTNFDAERAKSLAKSSSYAPLRNLFDSLLKMDMAENPHIAMKVRKAGIGDYGQHIMNKLFFTPNWQWVEKSMLNKNGWIIKNPYPVRIDGLGLSVKRFLLALKHERSLYWEFKERGKAPLNLWKQHLHKKLLIPRGYDKIMQAGHRMLIKMNKLEFFSMDTYVGDKKFLAR